VDVIKPLKELVQKLEEDEMFFDLESKNQHAKRELLAYIIADSLQEFMPTCEDEKKALQSLSYEAQLEGLLKRKIDVEVKFVAPKESYLITSLENTSISQRDKQEMAIKNLCHHLGIKKIEKTFCSRGNNYYSPEGLSFQSASNTILALSHILAVVKFKANIDFQR
jgi:hypothetical protein